MNSAPRFTSVLVLGSAPFALLDSYGHEPDLFGSVVVGSCFCFGWFLGFGLVPLLVFVRLIPHTPHTNSTR